jgi:hypothetical protein
VIRAITIGFISDSPIFLGVDAFFDYFHKLQKIKPSPNKVESFFAKLM